MQQISNWNVRQPADMNRMTPGTLAEFVRSVPGVAAQVGHAVQHKTGSRDYAAIASGSRRTVVAGCCRISTSAVV
jgi:hypothetical protein